MEIKLKHANNTVRPPQHSICTIYSKADWHSACERIEAFDWDAGLVEEVNLSWSTWHMNFMIIMENVCSAGFCAWPIALFNLHQ